ncbi:tail fiber domain-containing protein [Stenotrophomonas maltophilia]|uniref:tail fiber domain-containing protein n=1 Tax=Stenotrophomonas maltophilia TaxID=40324 RepID=UPI002B1DA6C3|nr:tail fiber domain-containing protein [Stenotrophomonas maltophilia]
MKLKITTAGRNALVNLPNTGTNAVLVSQVGLTSSAFAPGAGMSALPGEFKRVNAIGGLSVGDDTIHVTIRDDSADTYTLRGFGLYLSDGTLFATFGQADPIMEKASASMLLLSADTQFVDVDTTQIVFGSTEFLNPPATTETLGVVELATNTESEDGNDTQRAVTPRGLRAFIDKRFGGGAPTTFTKNLLAIATAAAFRTALEIKGAALKDTGHGNGLDADTLDGRHASEFALAGDFATVGHKHNIPDVNGLQAALDGKANLSGATFTGSVAVRSSIGFDYQGAAGRILIRDNEATTGVTIDAVTPTNSAFAPLGFRGTDFRFNGASVWHAANFNPDAKANLTGATFKGRVNIDAEAIALNGWNGKPGDGVLYFGNQNSYIYKSGGMFVFRNGETSLQANLDSGGTIWTTGNFDPGSKVNRGGDTMTGGLNYLVGAYGTQQVMMSYGYASGGVLWRTVLDVGGVYSLWRYPGGNPVRTLWIQGDGQVNNVGNLALYKDVPTMSFRSPAGNIGYDIFSNISNSVADGIHIRNAATGQVLCIFRDAYTQVTTRFVADGGYDTGSSRKLKDISGPIPYGLAEVMRMELVAGQYKSDYNADGRKRLFMIAEQVAELVPEAVDLEGVEYGGELVPSIKIEQLLPVAFNAIKELAAEVRDLRARLGDDVGVVA